MKEDTFVESVMKSFKSFRNILPMLLAVILSVGLFDVVVSQELLASVFQGSMFYDTLIGTLAGGVSVGQPVASYIIGGELLESGVSLYAVVALIVSWVTLGFVQIPLEQALFGRRFTVQRNLLGLIFAMLATIASVEIIKGLS
ncbi:MAG: permease [Campylobacterota bacterium]|nr:permease [Campylobacterota bacterium]